MKLPNENKIKEISAKMGVSSSSEAFVAARRRAETGEPYKPFTNSPVALPGYGPSPADDASYKKPLADEGFPLSSDQSARAHAHRAKNHLEAALMNGDGDDIDMSRLTSARACLDKAIACRGRGGSQTR